MVFLSILILKYGAILSKLKEEQQAKLKKAYIEMHKDIKSFDYVLLDDNQLFINNFDVLTTTFIKGLISSKSNIERYSTVQVGFSEKEIKITKSLQFQPIEKEDSALFAYKNDSIISKIYQLPSIEMADIDSYYISEDNVNNIESFFSTDTFLDPKHYGTKLQSLYSPNKPSQSTPSEKGYGISLLGLIRCVITNGQDKRIYLEKNSGFIPSYSCFAVVDCSSSTCSFSIFQRSIQTIISLFAALSKIESVSFTLIAATQNGPNVICLNNTIQDVFQNNSPVIYELSNLMQTFNSQVSISDSLNCVQTIRSKQQELESICFVFTDGQVSNDEKEKLLSINSSLETLKTTIIGVGIGIAPINIKNIFKLSVWSMIPHEIPLALEKLIKKEYTDDTNISIPKCNPPTKENIDTCINILKNGKPIYASFVDALSNAHVSLASTRVYLNKVSAVIQKRKNLGKGKFYSGKKTRGYYSDDYDEEEDIDFNDENEDLGKGSKFPIKILICQFWDACMVERGKENGDITYQVLVGKNGVVEALKSLGVTVDVVQNYRDSISCITSGEYHQVWVICGRGDAIKPQTLPENKLPSPALSNQYIKYNNIDDYRLVLLFIDTLEEFRRSGGGITFWGDAGFTYELNYYLQRAKLYNCIRVTEDDKRISIKARFSLTDPSKMTTLEAGKIIDSKGCYTPEHATFDNRDDFEFGNIDRCLYGFNVSDLYEGDSIACADPKCSIAPFRPFSYSTLGYISNAYYMAPLNTKEGDIVIDGAASRLFIELSKTGIRRLVRNIAVWLTSYERYNLTMSSEEIIRKKPPKFEPPELPKEKVNKFEGISSKTVDIAFVLDTTQSTEQIISAVRTMIKDLINFVSTKFKDKTVRIASVQFKDLAMAKYLKAAKRSNSNIQIDNNKSTVHNFVPTTKFDFSTITSAIAKGGCGDGPEDWVDAFSLTNKLNWNSDENTRRILVMITDQGGHGVDYHLPLNIDDEYMNNKIVELFDKKQQIKLYKEIGKLVKKEIEIIFLSTTKYSLHGYNALHKDYMSNGGKKNHINVISNIFDQQTLDQIKSDFTKIINRVINETFMSTRESSIMKEFYKKEDIKKKKEEGIRKWQNVTKQSDEITIEAPKKYKIIRKPHYFF